MSGDGAGEWQLNKSVTECNQYLLDTGLASDCAFLVGQGKNTVEVKAHKYILLARSPVFFAMFCGHFHEDTKKPIEIPDIEPNAFKQMLRFLYTDKTTITTEYVLPTLYSSKKYMVPALSAKCFQFLEKNLDAENVCLILEQSVLYNESTLMDTCTTFLENRTKEVLSTPGFIDLSQQTIIKLLKFESLAVTELELFWACLAWSKEECKRQELEETPANQRKVIGNALFLIHFPCLSMGDFSKYVSKTGILSAEEKCAVFEFLACEPDERALSDLCVPFPTHHRHKPEPCVLSRFSEFGNTVVCSGECSTIKVKVDREIVLRGIGMCGSLCYDPVSEIQVSLKQEKNELVDITSSVKDDMTGKAVCLMLQQGISCKPGLWYILKCTLHFSGDNNNQGYCQRGKSGEKIRILEGVTFEFDRTDLQTGLIHDILFSK